MSTSPRTFRFGLQTKVLIAVLGFLVLLPVLTLWIVNDYMRQQMEDEALRSLAAAESVFAKSLDNRAQNFVLRYRTVVNEARFQVTASLADRKTLDGLLGKLLEDSPEDNDAFIYAGENGQRIAARRRAATVDLEKIESAAAAITRLALAGQASTGTVAANGRAYSIVAVPVNAPDSGPLLGALTVAIRIGDGVIKDLKLPRTEILLVADGQIVASTMAATDVPETLLRDSAAATSSRDPREVGRVVIGGEHFMVRSGLISGASADRVRYVMLSSYEQRLHALEHTRQTVAVLSLGGIIVSTLLVSWFVRRITRPLVALRDSAEAVGRGDFSHRIETFSNDECGDLAQAFNGMTANLQTSRAELERAMQQVKATQEQLIQSEKLSAVGQFVAGVAHELNNPLTAVIGFSELLQSMPAEPKTHEFLDKIAKSAHRSHKIVHSLLSFARQHPPERRLVELPTIVNEVLEIMAYDLRTSNVTVIREFAPNLPTVLGDPHQLQQVFINIIGNARQAIEPVQREGRIVIRMRQNGGTVVIEFQDNGPGIRLEHLARIFDPFFTTKPVGKGTGLGLSLCYGIIKEHGGTISARSEPGQGATFAIELPVATQSDAKATALRDGSTSPFPAAPSGPSGKTVLVIDDEQWILDLATELLRAEGHAVETVTGGQQALDLLDRRKFDVIVSDWKMPGLNGVRLYEHLQAKAPATAQRVLFMTGDVVSDTFQEFLRKNGLTCLSKPFATREFRAAIAKVGRK